jgi:predicted transcriptional regulator
MELEDATDLVDSIGQIGSGMFKTLAVLRRNDVHLQLGYSDFGEMVLDKVGGYFKLQAPERKELVQELIDEGMTQREVADVVGVSQKTVSRDTEPNDSKEFSEPHDSVAVESNDSKQPEEPHDSVAVESNDSKQPEEPHDTVEDVANATPEQTLETAEEIAERERREIEYKNRKIAFKTLSNAIPVANLIEAQAEYIHELLEDYGEEFKETTGRSVDDLRQALNQIRGYQV